MADILVQRGYENGKNYWLNVLYKMLANAVGLHREFWGLKDCIATSVLLRCTCGCFWVPSPSMPFKKYLLIQQRKLRKRLNEVGNMYPVLSIHLKGSLRSLAKGVSYWAH